MLETDKQTDIVRDIAYSLHANIWDGGFAIRSWRQTETASEIFQEPSKPL